MKLLTILKRFEAPAPILIVADLIVKRTGRKLSTGFFVSAPALSYVGMPPRAVETSLLLRE
jgi:hypothetical protein